MKCHYCGAEMTRKDFCLCCGTKWEEPAPAEPEEQLPEESVELAEISQEQLELEFPTDFSLNLSPQMPRLQLPEGRALWKMLLWGILTLGIYPTVIWSRIVTELNIAASRHDGARTMSYFGMLLLAPVTLGIYPLVWMHKFCRRIGAELARRGIDYRFGARDFWLWNVLGILILVGPFVFTCRLMRAMNRINADFNVHG